MPLPQGRSTRAFRVQWAEQEIIASPYINKHQHVNKHFHQVHFNLDSLYKYRIMVDPGLFCVLQLDSVRKVAYWVRSTKLHSDAQFLKNELG